jgi:hypothetical protein
VYAIQLADYQRLPAKAIRLRERRIWHFTENDVSRLIICQRGKTREIRRNGSEPQNWVLAEGSQGIINPLAVNETVKHVGQVVVGDWVAHGTEARNQYGFSTNGLQITFELQNTNKLSMELAAPSDASYSYAAVTLDGEPWVFEVPFWLYRWMVTSLSIPPDL